tara:strand:+ start:3560 stop:4171 length:612 start_codon:yes stop_codon:yes gene_type:complete
MKKVAVIHGVFMNKLVMRPLSTRIEEGGYKTLSIHYDSFNFNLEGIFKTLDAFFDGEEHVAIVGWSLGGLIARAYLERNSSGAKKVQKVITLGTPHKRSHMARFFFSPLPNILRPGASTLLLHSHQSWDFECPLYSIAGSNNKGLFWLLSSSDSDGTVEIEETMIEGMALHLIRNKTHAGLIFSRDVAKDVLSILNNTLDSTP